MYILFILLHSQTFFRRATARVAPTIYGMYILLHSLAFSNLLRIYPATLVFGSVFPLWGGLYCEKEFWG